MYLTYLDESGDDGLPGSSPLFVLASIYLHHSNWQTAYNLIREFRRKAKEKYTIPIKFEIHTREFLLNKNPYRALNLPDPVRITFILEYAQFIQSLAPHLQVLIAGINKPVIRQKNYPVLENAVTYLTQRIENSLYKQNSENKFLMITDEGRVGTMTSITRKIQRINYIPSQFGGPPIRKEIKAMIEDPLPKRSTQSLFIQLSDFMAYMGFAYLLLNKTQISLANRMPKSFDRDFINDVFKVLKPVLNLQASTGEEFGIIWYPKQ